MGCLRFALAVFLLLLADQALAAGPPMLQEVIQGVGRGLRHRGAAKFMSSGDFYKDTEKHTVSFHTDQIHQCQRMGCHGSFETCNGNNENDCSGCQSDAYAETHLSCRKPRDYYSSYGDNTDNFLHGGTRNLAGHCSWEIRRIYGFGIVYEPDGRTQKFGTVRGMCTIYDQAEECNKDKDGGPLCGGMTITVDGYWFRTPDGWWKANEDVRLEDDNRYGYCYGNPSACYTQPSCCLLDDINILDAGQCYGAGRREGERTTNAATNFTDINLGAPRVGSREGRKLQQTSESASTSSYGVGTASYGHNDHEYSGSYVTGTADLIWGTFYATNMHSKEKWEDEGLFQWVVDTYPVTNPVTGTPPANRFETDPNSVLFMFSKEVQTTYGYPESTRNN